MSINTQMLAQQIQRLLVDDKDKQRLTEQLEGLNEEKKVELVQLIQEHDKEAMGLLNQKAEEVETIKGQLNEVSAPVDDSAEELREISVQLKQLLKDPEKFSMLIAECDDAQLAQIQAVIEAGFAGKEEAILQSQQFFQEVRLQKAAFTKENQVEQKQMMTEAIMSRKEQNMKLEGLIREAEGVLGKKYS
jgi:uncharacterized membrane protein affecting hemolysin expression